MANDGRVETRTMTADSEQMKQGIETEVKATSDILDDRSILSVVDNVVRAVSNAIDTPRALLIVRDAALTLVEVREEISYERLLLLLADKEYRQGIVTRLVNTTPNYWDSSWNAAWKEKDAEPLYSEQQQRIARRRSLISFWTKEFDTLPTDQLNHVNEVLHSFT